MLAASRCACPSGKHDIFCFGVLYMLNLSFSADIFLKSFCLKVSCTKKREGGGSFGDGNCWKLGWLFCGL